MILSCYTQTQSQVNCDNLWSYLWLLFLTEQNITENIPQNTSSWASFQRKEIVLRWNIAEKKKIYREKTWKKEIIFVSLLKKVIFLIKNFYCIKEKKHTPAVGLGNHRIIRNPFYNQNLKNITLAWWSSIKITAICSTTTILQPKI